MATIGEKSPAIDRSSTSVTVSRLHAAKKLDEDLRKAATVESVVPRNMAWAYTSLRRKVPTLNLCHDVRSHLLMWLDLKSICAVQRVSRMWRACVLDFEPIGEDDGCAATRLQLLRAKMPSFKHKKDNKTLRNGMLDDELMGEDDDSSAASFQIFKAKMQSLARTKDPNASRIALQWVSYAGHVARRLIAKADKIQEMLGDDIDGAQSKLNAALRPALYARQEAFAIVRGAYFQHNHSSTYVYNAYWTRDRPPADLPPLLMRCFLMAAGFLEDRSDIAGTPIQLWHATIRCLRTSSGQWLDDHFPKPEVLRWVKATYEANPTLSPSAIGTGSHAADLAAFIEVTVDYQKTFERSSSLSRELQVRKGVIDHSRSMAEAYMKLGKDIVMANIRRQGESQVWWNALSGVVDYWAQRS